MTLWHESNLSASVYYNGVAVNVSCEMAEVPLLLASTALSAGWSCGRSGDGGSISATSYVFNTSASRSYNGTFNSYGDRSSPNSPTIARSFYNLLCHFSLIPPNGDGELTIQTVDIGDGFIGLRIKFSSGGFTGSNPTQQPSPAAVGDELILFGGGTDASPTSEYVYMNPRGAYRIVIGVDDSSTTPMLYMFVWNSAGIIFSLIWATITGRVASGDVKASMVYVDDGPPIYTLLGNESALGSNGYGVATRFGSSGTQKMSAAYPVIGAGAAPLVRALGKQFPPGGHYRQRNPILVLRNPLLLPQRGLKGKMENTSWCLYDVPTFQILDNGLTRTRGAFVVVGDLVLPFNQFGTHGANGSFPRR